MNLRHIVFLVDGSSAMAPYWMDMMKYYINPIITQLSKGKRLFDQDLFK